MEIGLDQLPGDNPIYNCTQTKKPKTPDYQETAQIVTLTAQTGGGCLGDVCTEYKGGGAPATDTAPKTGFQESVGQGGALTADGHLAINGEGIDQPSSVSGGTVAGVGTGAGAAGSVYGQDATGGSGSAMMAAGGGGVGTGSGPVGGTAAVQAEPAIQTENAPAMGSTGGSTVDTMVASDPLSTGLTQTQQPGMPETVSELHTGALGGAGSGGSATGAGAGAGAGADAGGGLAGTSPTAATSSTPPVSIQGDSSGGGAGIAAGIVTVTVTVTAPCSAPTTAGESGGWSSGGVMANEVHRAAANNSNSGAVAPVDQPAEAQVGSTPASQQTSTYGVPDAMMGGKMLGPVQQHKVRALVKGKRHW